MMGMIVAHHGNDWWADSRTMRDIESRVET